MTEADEVLAAWARVLESGRFVLGSELEAFERELAAYIGVDHAVGVSSGTDALTIALETLEVRGGEVIVPALTFIATAEAVIHAGATPVFADVDRDTWCLSPETVAPHFGPLTKAIVPVHLFGNPAPVDELRRFAVPMLEDACQAVGATVDGYRCGSLGDIAAVSFYPSKLLAGFGDGGAILTNHGQLAARARLLRSHGSVDNEHHRHVGRTARLDELQAAGLRIRLRNLQARLEQHQDRGTGDQWMIDGAESACHQTVYLGEGEGRHLYPVPCHLQPAMRDFYRGPLPNAERFSRANHAESPIEETAGAPQTESGEPAPEHRRGRKASPTEGPAQSLARPLG